MMGHPFLERLSRTDVVTRCGRVTRILPTFVEADGPNAPLGALCQIETRAGQDARGPIQVMAEVVGVKGASIVLAPFDDRVPTFAGARVEACPEADGVGVGDGYLGRAIDGLGRPIDNLPSVRADQRRPWEGSPTPPLERTATRRVLRTGVRAIDGLLTLAEGQRVGVFAASGVGKTSLITQMAQQIEADRCVICLVGERGREVEALWSEGLSPQARARTVLVAATSDQSAATRVRAGGQALALAEHWRDQGRHVLLILDSVTRLAMALRETGLAAGEPPTVRAYTPGVFAALPKIVERCGALKSGGAITALFTVLSETDEVDDPVCEMMKSLLDGHIILARRLAEQGHYPAIDVPRSISRLAGELNDRAHRTNVNTAVAQLSAFEASRTLIEAGVYVPGANRELDEALERRPALLSFLRQGQDEFVALDACRAALSAILGSAT